MPSMRAQRRETQHADVVLGPCPGCDVWQLDYTDEVAAQYAKLYPPEAGQEGIQIDMSEWHDLIESVLQEHLQECPHLMDLLAETR